MGIRLIAHLSRCVGIVAFERCDGLGSRTVCRPGWLGLLTRCRLVVSRRGRGCKEASPCRPESDMPTTVSIGGVYWEVGVTGVIIGIDPHKGSHTAVAVDRAENK